MTICNNKMLLFFGFLVIVAYPPLLPSHRSHCGQLSGGRYRYRPPFLGDLRDHKYP